MMEKETWPKVSESKDDSLEKKEPKIHFRFLFSRHVSKEDTRQVKEELPQADIFTPEMFGYDQKMEADLNRLSRHLISLEEFWSERKKQLESASCPDFIKELTEIIAGSDKEIVLAEMSKPETEDRQILVKNRQSKEILSLADRLFRDGHFKEALKTMKAGLRIYQSLLQEREKCFKQNLKSKIQKIVKQHPDKKNEWRVLIFFGPVHTPVYHQLKKEEPASRFSRRFQITSHQPEIFPLPVEILRRVIFHKPISDELITQSLFASLILPSVLKKIFRQNLDSHTAELLQRYIADRFSVSEIEEITLDFQEGKISPAAVKKLHAILSEINNQPES